MADRLERLINLVIALREARRPMTTEEIRERVAGYDQEEAESFRRMFERDKADLRSLGVPVETAPVDRWEDRVGYRIDPRRYDLPEIRLAPDELAALTVALEVTGLTDDASGGLLKLGVDAGDPGGWRVPPPAMRLDLGDDLDAARRSGIVEALVRRTVVRFDYEAPGRPPERREVEPHALVHRRGRWYLVGHDRARDDRRAFRVDRIPGAIVPTGPERAFPPPPRVGVDDVVPAVPSDGPETAEVLAAPAIAWQVARRARGAGRPVPSDVPGERGDWVALSVAVGDPDDFVGWALEYGDELEVLAPDSLRERLIGRLRAALDRMPAEPCT